MYDRNKTRELKFKVWDSLNKTMILNPKLTVINGVLKGNNEHEIVLQFTGRKDQEKNEIYEGDILRLEYHPDLPTTKNIINLIKYLVVHFYENHSHYSAVDDRGSSYSVGFGGSAIKSYVVVGNIYENLNLMSDKHLSGLIKRDIVSILDT